MLNRYVHPRPMQENPKRWGLITLSRPICRELTQIICQQISSCSSRVIAALGIAEVTQRRVSPVAAVSCESPTSHCSDSLQNVSDLRSGVIQSLMSPRSHRRSVWRLPHNLTVSQIVRGRAVLHPIGPAGIARKPDADCTAEHRSGGASPLPAPLRIAHNGSGQRG